MSIYLLENTLQIEIFYEFEDHDLEDNICLSIKECCPPDERLFRSGKTNIFLTNEEARQLGEALIEASEQSRTPLTR